MNKVISGISLVLIPASLVLANEQWLGTFSGKETMTLSGCKLSQYNGTVERDWSVTHADLNGNQYSGTGKIPGEPDFLVSGTIDDNIAKGKARGKDQWGNTWTSTSDIILEGDVLKINHKGTSPSTGCSFTGEITATRQ